MDLSARAAAGLELMIQAQDSAEDIFATRMINHADWILVYTLLRNDLAGRATVVKHLIERTGRSPGTVRNQLRRFAESGLIMTQQRIGRSELYLPTNKLKKAVNDWGHLLMREIEGLEDARHGRTLPGAVSRPVQAMEHR